jgi:hypothetical protein
LAVAITRVDVAGIKNPLQQLLEVQPGACVDQ